MRPGEGWTTDRKPNLLIRVRAWFALRAYRKSEKRYRRLLQEIEALKAEQEAVLTSMAADNRAGRLDKHEFDDRATNLMRITERLDELAEPRRKADAAMRSATAKTQTVLRDIGFREISNWCITMHMVHRRLFARWWLVKPEVSV